MFGFGRRVAVAAPNTTAAGTVGGYTAQTVMVAAPDTPAINRVLALQGAIGAGLAGHSGLVVGHDRGAPERSFTGPIAGAPGRTTAAAMGAVRGLPSSIQLGQAEYADSGSIGPADPRAALLWDRMNQA